MENDNDGVSTTENDTTSSLALDRNNVKSMDSGDDAIANEAADSIINQKSVTSCVSRPRVNEGAVDSASDVPVSLNDDQTDGHNDLVVVVGKETGSGGSIPTAPTLVESNTFEDAVLDGETMDVGGNNLDEDELLKDDGESSAKSVENEKSTRLADDSSSQPELNHVSNDEAMDVDESEPNRSVNELTMKDGESAVLTDIQNSTSESNSKECQNDDATDNEILPSKVAGKEIIESNNSVLDTCNSSVTDKGEPFPSIAKDLSNDLTNDSSSGAQNVETVRKDQDDSSQPLGMDETSMNASENGSTKFVHQDCDQDLSQDEDISEIAAVDPFAQTGDSDRGGEESMDVDDGQERDDRSNDAEENSDRNNDGEERGESVGGPEQGDKANETEERAVGTKESEPSEITEEAASSDKNESESRAEKEPANSEELAKKGDATESSIVSSQTSEGTSQEDAALPKESSSGEEGSRNDSTEEMQEVRPLLVEPEIEIDEEVCIIPDTVRLPPLQGGSQKKDVTVLNEVPVVKNSVKKEVPEIKQESSSSGRPQRQAAKRADAQIKATVKEMELEEEGEKENEEDVDDTVMQLCQQCGMVKPCKYNILNKNKVVSFLCSEVCANQYREALLLEDHPVKSHSVNHVQKPAFQEPPVPHAVNASGDFIRQCSQCKCKVVPDERTLSWETMDFCNEDCLGKYQNCLGSHCAYCKKAVQQASLGKYCVRFGYDIRQFCSSGCLEEYKRGLKVCSYCQKDISSSEQGFLAPVGDKGQFKDFCTQACMEKYDQMSNNQPPPAQMHPCDVCNNNKLVVVEVLADSKVNKLCSEVCFAAFKFVNTINVDQCDMCRKYFDKANLRSENLTVFYDEAQHNFCGKTCMNVYILAKRKIVPCNWCKVKKYNFDMIKRVLETGQTLMMCSLNCLTLYKVSINAVSSRRIKCDCCGSIAQAQYHLTMSDATIRNFCTYPCVMNFQAQYSKNPITLPGGQSSPIPTGGPKRAIQPPIRAASKDASPSPVPVISSVTSLATPNGTSGILQTVQSPNSISPAVNATKHTVPNAIHVNSANKGQPALNSSVPGGGAPAVGGASSGPYIIIREKNPPKMVNKSTSFRPPMHTKGVSCKPHACAKEVQTDGVPAGDGRTVLIPIPVPIYIPAPMHMFSFPTPVPVPFPLPVPVPIFIPTTRGSASGIMEEIKRIQDSIPTDPFEAELIMMAEMVAEDKKAESENNSDDAGGGAEPADSPEPCGSTGAPSPPPAESVASTFGPEVIENSSSAFGDDMLQMALKMASELDGPADLEAELTPNKIPQPAQTSLCEQSDDNEEDVDDPEPIVRESPRGRKRGRPSRGGTGSGAAKRGRKVSNSHVETAAPALQPPSPSPSPTTPVLDKPDSNLCLKFTLGVNAWKHWVVAKNAELEKQAVSAGTPRKTKSFKTEILQLTADELNYTLCMFVKEARKPNGSEYAPDTIYYFCLGIQQYLFENGRIDNIFTDSYYEKFTECLNDVAKKFAILDDSQLIVTRVEEEHLWESKQLGAHSPHVLLSTLMFFNTKHFNLATVDEHMQLSFSHIMKHWKRNPNQPGTSVVKTPGSRNVLLRFYPPQSALDANSKKKKLYEQQENEDNPLRCPVKLYEFYLSKCPESVKSRNDVFYLLPERSCVPDSPVWYSTMALGEEALLKMLHRVKMVKEINMALVNS